MQDTDKIICVFLHNLLNQIAAFVLCDFAYVFLQACVNFELFGVYQL